MTEKLYYKDAYIKEFNTTVVSCAKCECGYDVVLSSTAFFPEEGGQSADTGFIGDSKVLDVYEEHSIVHHITDTPVMEKLVCCKIDFEERFEKMQIHTAEHMLCGIIHKRFGLENVGFHLGSDVVTFDINGVLGRDELDLVEDEANEAVFKNITVEAFFPSEDELQNLVYRSKLDIKENVRIVKIGEVDSCACCAPHVAYTGEIGIIKILDFDKHKGGLRIKMVAGRRALLDYRIKYANIKKISGLLSEPQHTTADFLEKHLKEEGKIRAELKDAKIEIVKQRAETVRGTEGNFVVCLENSSPEEMREFANIAKTKVSGLLVVITGCDGDYKYIIMSQGEDLSGKIKEINKVLCGRGGGRGEMVQGTFSSTLSEIKSYFTFAN